MKVRLEIDGESFDVTLERGAGGFRVECEDEAFEARPSGTNPVSVDAKGRRHVVEVRGDHEALFDGHAVRFHVAIFEPGSSKLRAGHAATMSAMMTGRLVKVLVKAGDHVKKGQPLFVLESMKMQNELASPSDAVVQDVLVREGETIESGRGLARLEPAR